MLQKKDKNAALHALKKLGLHTVTEVHALDEVSVIAIVGQGMLDNYGIAARIFTAAARVGINIKISSTGASQVVSYLVVDRENRDKAVKEIHDEFFTNN